MEGQKKDLQSLLREASRLSNAEPIPIITNRDEGVARAIQVMDDDKQDKWEKVTEALNGEFADRFIDEMRGLSGREFVRIYTKMLEYVRPKIIRVESKPLEEQDNVLRIEVYNSVQEQKIIDITQEEDGAE